MTHSRDDDARRLAELLADRATVGLAAAEQEELTRLLRTVPDAESIAAEYDAIEGALVESQHASAEPLPASLRAALAAEGRRVAGGIAGADGPPAPLAFPGPGVPREASRRRPVGQLGWLAAAAALLLAATAWWPSGASEERAPTPADRRASLVRDVADTVTLLLDPTDDPAAQGVIAEIVWSDSRQEGYLRVRGLAVNDPSREQYQLWIYDETRNDMYPVDGGVFDVAMSMLDPVTQSAIIPIDAKLMVGGARSFAVTIERPGGVVVTDRSRTLLLGNIRGSLG